MTYEGWSNYETWAVKLWMDNEEYTYRNFQEEAKRASRAVDSRGQLAEAIKMFHEEQLPEIGGFAGDLLTAAFGEVDWYEIADSLLADFEEDQEEN